MRNEQVSRYIVQQPIVLDELPLDDEWIAEIEELVLPSSNTWLSALDRASRRLARAAQNGEESTDEFQYEDVEVQMLSDDDEVAPAYNSYEIYVDDVGDDAQMGATTTGTTISDDVDDTSFGYND
ncbi:uncharacterized protein [Spinacia oleracea]|uniref:Uncharacterized protein LOC110801103 n=1 Tax=Spinacia oleracea TaxID=3562 RepID=A0A9R0J7K6_SPIOL|nr:uncharacterized protein LOC110801103 isoform X2 [Spinacia oleracea]XP_056699680.1 uncharacterized protein LOC110801103 isoform X2 [Spinacia oleracea]XP_056699681.1 uncharacterized protein LOC110801103 isoform X2 [Spinacia oleracea]XP_056699682.1 uncharacterized protein LOC110801103 isoform X2 [Spinacia oleracea]